jgi:carbamoyltransferase
VELLAKGRIVARVQSRVEWGARALGNRSILADASDPSNVRRINDMIKMRDFWMPFAPSILSERASDYLVNPKGISAPYMILSFDTTERRNEIQAAIHPADSTARPQVVQKEHNQTYWRLLDRFAAATGRGGLLNTSFNLHGEPLVASPEDALSTFVRSGLEYMALGEYVVSKT